MIYVWDTRFENCRMGKAGRVESKACSIILHAHGELLKPTRKRTVGLFSDFLCVSKTFQIIRFFQSFSPTDTVTSVAFLKNGIPTLASTGASDSSIKYWDLRASATSVQKAVASCEPVQYGKRSFGNVDMSISITQRLTYLYILIL